MEMNNNKKESGETCLPEELMEGSEYLHPAIDYWEKETVCYFGVVLERQGGRVPVLITSKGEVIECTDGEISRRGIRFKKPLSLEELRWSRESINSFLNGKADAKFPSVFWSVRNRLTKHIDFSDERLYDFMALWIMGTYLFPLFKSYPYVYLNGTKESGKTKVLEVVSCLGFNAIHSASITPAVLFRLIESRRPTVLFDESEKLRSTYGSGDIMNILNQGYKRSGKAYRTNLEIMEPESFEVYGPKMIANIYGLESVLESRTIGITMFRTTNPKIANRCVDESNPIWQYTRDRLYCSTLKSWREIKAVYDGLSEPRITGRQWELWKPILALAKYYDGLTGLTGSPDSLYGKMVELALEKSEERLVEDETTNRDMSIVKALLKVVNEDGEYLFKEIITVLKDYYGEEERWINPTYVGRSLRRLGIINKRHTSTGIVYSIKRSQVIEIAKRLGILINSSDSSTGHDVVMNLESGG